MRNNCRWLLALVLLLLLPAMALAEKLDTQEALCDFFTQQRLAEERNFEVSCKSDLLKALKADDYALLKDLCQQTGVSKYDFRVTLFGKLCFYDVRYTNPDAIKCETENDIRIALQQAVEKGATEIELHMPEELFQQMYGFDTWDIYRLLHELNITDADLDSKRKNELIIKELRPSDLPFAKVHSVGEAGERIAAWKDEPAFNLLWEPEVLQNLTIEDINLMEFLGGLEFTQMDYDRSTGLMRLYEMHYKEIPGVYCTTEQEVVDAIRAMGVNGVSDFELKLEDTMYEDLKRNEYARLNELKSEGGMMEGYFSDSDYHHMFKFRQTVILADVPIMRSLDEIMDYMRTCAWRGDKDINILMTPEVYASLTDNMDTLFGTHGKYFDMMPNAGIMEYDAELNRHARSLRLRDIRYFPGVDILRAVSNRTTETLTDREQQTLSIALEMASACGRDTPAETARAIHDALCERITYVIDRETLEDDTCIGALLDGQANCDGYADAMLLVGRLAGLNILYQHGDSQQEHISLSTHLWNLIELDGTWRMIDVTWDDNLGDLRYHWFNVGEDRAAQTHKWEREMTMPMLPVTDLNDRPVAEYLVSTTEEITEAARQAQRSGHKVIDLYVTTDLDKETVRDAAGKKLKGTGTTFWYQSLKCLHIVMD